MTDTPDRRWLRRTVGCLVKAPLGCLAFVAGATAIVVLFLPPVLGSLASDGLEDWFASSRAGRLELHDAWLGSFYGEQRIERVVLRDPEGAEILRGEVTAPSLSRLGGDGGARFGPIEVWIDELTIVRGADGVTNLERALERRPRERARFDFESPPLSLVVFVDRLAWLDADGRSLVVEDLALDAVLDRVGRRHELAYTGRGTIAGAAGSSLELRGSVEDVARDLGRAPWSFELRSGPAPAVLPSALLGASASLAALFGERIDTLDLELWPDEQRRRRVALTVTSEAASLGLSARWPIGEARFVGGPEDVCQVEFAAGSPAASRLVAQVLPLADVVELAPDARTTLLLSDFVLPFDGDLARFAGRGTFVVDELTYRFDAPIGARFRSSASERLSRPSMTVRFDDGCVVYERFGMPAGRVLLRVDGKYDLRAGAYELSVTPPGEEPVRVRGTRLRPEVE